MFSMLKTELYGKVRLVHNISECLCNALITEKKIDTDHNLTTPSVGLDKQFTSRGLVSNLLLHPPSKTN